ncbi:MAG: extracellular solute-binding protein [Parvibaculales bacterium]
MVISFKISPHYLISWLALTFFSFVSPVTAAEELKTHGLAMHGAPQLANRDAAFSYTDPRPIKGSKIVFAKLGSFDSLNPFIVRGQAAAGLRDYVYESLLVRHFDEPFTLYALLAKNVSMPVDRRSVTFELDERARFSDGSPVTIEDIKFSYETLRDKGRPNHRYYYGKVKEVITTDTTIQFLFDPQQADLEMPLIMGLMPIFPKHDFTQRNFNETSLKPPIGSGPYIVAEVQAGKKIIYEKNPNYWGQDLAVNAGRHNLNEIYFDYYRDENTAFEAFKTGLVDIWEESNPLRWTRGYNFPAAKDGRIIQENIKTGTPSGLYGFVFNTRRAQFSDVKTREALSLIFNFDWVNKNLFANAYQRTESYFQNSDLSALNIAANASEKKILRGAGLDKSILEKGYHAPKGDVSGQNRAARAQSIQLLKQAGYEIRNGRMLHQKTGAFLNFEIMVQTREEERLAIAYSRMLKRIGVTARVRFVDSTQYQNRLQKFDYDMIINRWYASLSPGNEQAFYWSSQAADNSGSRNYPGVKSPYIDAAIDKMTQAKTRQELVTASRALDRLLLAGHYVVPLYHQPEQWVARWHHVEHSWRHSLYGVKFDSWWVNPDN